MSTFNQYELMHAATSRKRTPHCIALRCRDIKNNKEITLKISKPAFGGLVEAAQAAFNSLSKEAQDAFIDPNASPFDQLDQKVAFLNMIAPEYMEKIKSPFIQDIVDLSSKSFKDSRRIIGMTDGKTSYEIVECQSPKKSITALLKAGFNMKGVHAAALAEEQMAYETSNFELKTSDIRKVQTQNFLHKISSQHADMKTPSYGSDFTV